MHNCSDNHNETAPERGRLASPGFTVHEDQDGAEKAANLVDGHTGSLGVGIARAHLRIGHRGFGIVKPANGIRALARCHERQVLLEIVEREKGAQDALVVAKHEETAGRDDADAIVESTPLEVAAARFPFGQGKYVPYTVIFDNLVVAAFMIRVGQVCASLKVRALVAQVGRFLSLLTLVHGTEFCDVDEQPGCTKRNGHSKANI